jgi:2-polyprenyl-6-methoxyphenol hydroxylase-like FAD-dependent oxidoreductase
VHSQRETFERVLRASAAQVPGLVLRTAHVDRIEVVAGRASGLRIGSGVVGADLVVDATGRSGRTSDALTERVGIGGPCGIAYVDRVYRLRPGEGPGPMGNAIIYGAFHDGYEVLAAPHEHGLFSVVILRRHDDHALAALRVPALFDRAVAAIPSLAAWAAPDRADPVTDPLPGANLVNRYRSQGDLPGVAFVGDSVCTTTPNFGRGVTTSFLQVAALLRQLDEHGADLDAALAAYAGWCEESMRPWVEDHIAMDGGLARRWGGEPLDLDQPVPTDLVVAAAEQDPGIGELIAPFLSMQAGPASLGPARERARAVYAGGWRPAYPPGPTRDELAALLG